jgi:hypothetical protein
MVDMPEDEDYEIISKKDLATLRGDVKQLREGGAPSENTVLSRLNQMLDLFKEASMSMKEEKPTYERLDEINEKMDRILEQHKQLAEGILAVADMIKAASGEEAEKPEQQNPMPNQMPNFNAPQMAPPPMPNQMPQRPMQNPMNFPKTDIPSFNPLEEGLPREGPEQLPPMPPRPGKARVLGF